MEGAGLFAQELTMIIPAEEDSQHYAAFLIEEENRDGARARKFTFNQGNIRAVFCLDMPGRTVLSTQVEITVAVETRRQLTTELEYYIGNMH